MVQFLGMNPEAQKDKLNLDGQKPNQDPEKVSPLLIIRIYEFSN